MDTIIDFQEEKTKKVLNEIESVASQTLGQNFAETPMPAEDQNYDGYVYSVRQFEAQYGVQVIDDEMDLCTKLRIEDLKHSIQLFDPVSHRSFHEGARKIMGWTEPYVEPNYEQELAEELAAARKKFKSIDPVLLKSIHPLLLEATDPSRPEIFTSKSKPEKSNPTTGSLTLETLTQRLETAKKREASHLKNSDSSTLREDPHCS
jgi:hypothetical protein